MNLRMKMIAVLIGASILVYIIELVRRRKLREEYAWLWMITGATIVVLAFWYDLLVAIGNFFGGMLPSSVLFFCGMVFLILILLHMSVKISMLTDQVKNLAQIISILRNEKEKG